MSESRIFRLAVLIVLATLSGCERGQSRDRLAAAGPDNAPPAASKSLPDWSGAWAIDLAGSVATGGSYYETLEKTLKPAPLAAYHGIFQNFVNGQGNYRESYCRPYSLGGFSGGFEGLIEFLFTPGRVTLIWEGGLVRRIYTDGRVLPEDPEPTTAVSSSARWENQTLLVETKLNPNAGPFFGGDWDARDFRVGEHARLSERIFLKDPDTLQIDMVLDAPSALTKPARLSALYHRVPNYYMSNYTTCPANDRALDPHTGHPTMNLTPPADLPPPPS